MRNEGGSEPSSLCFGVLRSCICPHRCFAPSLLLRLRVKSRSVPGAGIGREYRGAGGGNTHPDGVEFVLTRFGHFFPCAGFQGSGFVYFALQVGREGVVELLFGRGGG